MTSNMLTFFVRMKDMASGGLARLSTNVRRAWTDAANLSTRLTGANRNLALSYNEVRTRISQLEESIRSSRTPAHIRAMRQELAQLQRMEQRHAGNIQNRNGGGLMGMGKGLLMGAGLAAATAFGAGALTKGMEAQATAKSFEVMAGKEQGGQLKGDLTKYAEDSIYGTEVFGQAKTMLAFGIEAKKVMPTMKMMGDVASGNTETMKSLSLAFSQVKASGRLMGQDLLQFVNAGFNPLQVMTERMGVSMGVLKKKVEEGVISFEMVEQAFKDATGPGGKFFDMTNQIAQTDFGKWQAFQGQLDGFATKIGGLLAPVLGSFITNVLSPFVSWLEKSGVWIRDNEAALTAIIVPLTTLIGMYQAVVLLTSAWASFQTWIGSMTLATKLWTVAQTQLNVVMSLNPIGAVIALVAALAAVFYICWNKFQGFRSGVMGVWETVKGFGDIIKDFLIDRLMMLPNLIGGIGKAIGQLFEGEFSAAWDTAKDTMAKVSGWDFAQKAGAKMSADFNKGYQQNELAEAAKVRKAGEDGMLADDKRRKTEGLTATTANGGGSAETYKAMMAAAGGKGDKDKGAGKSVSGATGGGPRQVTINIQRFYGVGELVVDSRRAGETIAERTTEGLMRVLNSGAKMQDA